MEFCEKCESVLFPEHKGSKTVLVCKKCGKIKGGKISPKDFKLKSVSADKGKEIVVVDKKDKIETLPKTNDAICPKCGNHEAFWWMQQTRAADEAPTRFYKCTKCGHTWREYE